MKGTRIAFKESDSMVEAHQVCARQLIQPIRERVRNVLPHDGWVSLTPRDDAGSLGLVCRVSSLNSTWLSMCGSPTCDPLIGSPVRWRVEMSHINRINEKRRV
ncbi:hypothetical protein DVH24_042689 [Malus domestica]|uniref:Uncharacterized protein n=1 Tax=Malus domestica TaxID=3750 RepID=A0A498I0X6_MALDO|nr:hypothetical protein DVH24_042689 [Malus domestica]